MPCIPAFERDKIDVFSWKHIKTGLCELPMNKPFIIQNSTLKKWSKSTQKRILKAINNLSVKITVQSSDCNCFNNDTEKCIDYVNSLCFSSDGESDGMFLKRDSSFLHKYEANYRETIPYLNCIKKERKSVPISEALMISKYNELSLNKTAIMFPAPIQRHDLQE